jgi:hypothetical protein
MSSKSSPSADSSAKSTIKIGAQIVVDTLIEQGVDTMFGYLGGVVLPLFDRLYDAPINFIIPRHEQGGCHMADAYARASGKVGVVVATSGPGACNLVTGLATAMMDSVPIVALTGQVRTELIGNDAFQEADTTGITRPVTKHNCIVKDVKDLARTIREAFYIATGALCWRRRYQRKRIRRIKGVGGESTFAGNNDAFRFGQFRPEQARIAGYVGYARLGLCKLRCSGVRFVDSRRCSI